MAPEYTILAGAETWDKQEWPQESGTVTVPTTGQRSGNACYLLDGSGAASYLRNNTLSGHTDNSGRVYFKFTDVSMSNDTFTRLIYKRVSTTDDWAVELYKNGSGNFVLRFYDYSTRTTGTTTLSAGTWYQLEVTCDGTSGEYKVFLSDSLEITHSTTVSTGQTNIALMADNVGVDVYYDDFCWNTANFDRFPDGKLVLINPNGNGNDAWDSGGYGDLNDWITGVEDDTTTEAKSTGNPSAATDALESSTTAGIGSGDTINAVIALGMLARGSGSGAGSTHKLRIRSHTPTNDDSANLGLGASYGLYTFPTTLAMPTPTQLDSWEVGGVVTGARDFEATALALYIDYTPAGGGPTTKTVSDTGSGSDVVASILAFLTVVDTGSGVDVASVLGIFALADTGSGADAISVINKITVADTGVGADTVALTNQLVLSDTGSGIETRLRRHDILSAGWAKYGQFEYGDSEYGGGKAPVAGGVTKTVSDTGTGTDSVSIKVFVTVPDTGSGTDTVAVKAFVTVVDSGVGTDTVSVKGLVVIADTGVGSDVVTVKGLVVIADTGTGVDTVGIKVFLSIADTGVGTDVPSVKAFLTISDTGSGTDTLTIKVFLTVSDVGSGVDTVTTLQLNFVTIADVGSGLDTISVKGKITVTDAGTDTEAIVINVFLTVVDTGVGVDSPSILGIKTLPDVGIGTDGIAVTGKVTIPDVGVGDDVIVPITNRLTVFDSGVGLDLVTVDTGVPQIGAGVYKPIIRSRRR